MSLKGFIINGELVLYDYDDLADKPTIPAPITVDSALSGTSTNPVQNKVIKVALDQKGSGQGVSDDLKTALLQLAEKVAYIDTNGSSYYQDLYDALYSTPSATLTSITAVYTQTGVVYDSATLDSLKANLVVTGNYDDGTSQPVIGYTLSGTLTVGTSTITVTYQGKTTTFTVTVTATPTQYNITNNLTSVTNSNTATTIYGGESYSATLTASYSDYIITTVTVTMGGTDITSTAYSSGTISIANVTGNIVITAVATQRVATLSSINAVFAQGTAVIYNTDSLDELEQYLTVTATWSDSSTSTVAPTDYTLSGTLSVGTSTITVSYGGKSDTFTVTVTAEPIVPTGYTQYDYLTTTDSTGDYVNTGLTASGSFGGKSFSQLSCEVKMRVTSSLASSINILGCRSTSSGTGSNGAFQLFGKTDNTIQLYALGVDLTTSDTFTTNSATTVKYAANDNAMSTLTINNGTPNNVASLDFSTMTSNSRALVLYGTNRNGVFVVGSTATGVFQLGDVVFTNSNNQKVFEFIPVYSSADSKYGFYERVNEHFYPCNNGTLTGGNWS